MCIQRLDMYIHPPRAHIFVVCSCTCVGVLAYMCVYMFTFECIDMYGCMCMYTCLCLCMCMCSCLGVDVCAYMMYIHGCVCV